MGAPRDPRPAAAVQPALGLRHDEAEPDPSVPNDPDARPSLEEVLALRADRMRTVHDVIATLTGQQESDSLQRA